MRQPLHVAPSLKWTAITLILVVGLVHLVEAPEYFTVATYLGVLFIANAGAAAGAAWGISQQAIWGWLLGVVVAAGAIIAYLVSRTIGLPGFANATWFESIDILSLLVEGAFVVVAILAFMMPEGPMRQERGGKDAQRAA